MKKTIAIIVAAIFVFAMTVVSLAGDEKTEVLKPAENTSAGAPKATTPETEKLKKPGEPKEQGEFQFKKLTPEEEQKLLKEFEGQEKLEFKELTPEEEEELRKAWE